MTADPDDRFDKLLHAMVNKPPLDVQPKEELAEEDLREEEDQGSIRSAARAFPLRTERP